MFLGSCHIPIKVNLFGVQADCAVVGYHFPEWQDLTLQMLSEVT